MEADDSRTRDPGSTGPEDRSDAELGRLVCEYMDQLIEGKAVDPAEVLTRHPRLGPAILRELRTFTELEESPGSGHLTRSRTVGDYQLRRRIGRGGMGVVYEAWQTSMERRVALKVLPAGFAADTKVLARFMREAKVSGGLQHPNVVPVYGLGVEAETPYYAMELVEGETLAQILDRVRQGRRTETPGPLDAPEVDARYAFAAAEVFAGAAEGLHHAHSKGVIHRDLKPSNLILDRSGRLRILDFGLARMEGQASLTRSGDLMGTVLYMSPEQAMAKRIPVDLRTDIYSLGATLYEVLARRPPFNGKTLQETLSNVIVRDPPSLRVQNPRIPADLETIVFKCLRKDPAERYASAEALAQDLRRLVRGDAVEARPESDWERLRRHVWRARKSMVVAALFIALGGLSIAQAWRSWEEQRARNEKAYDSRVLQAAFRLELAPLVQRSRAGEQQFWGLRADSSARIFRSRDGDTVREALRVLEESQALIPARAEARFHRARALILLGKQKEADEVLDALISSAFVPAITLRADLLERRGAQEQAQSLVEAAHRAASQDWEKAWLDVWQGWRTDRLPEVEEAYSRIIDLASRGREPFLGCSLLARLGRGQAALSTADVVQALKDFSTVESLVPEAPFPALLSGKAWLAIGRTEEAERVFQRLFDRTDRKDEVAAAVWGVYAMRMGDQERALHWAGKLSIPSARETRRARTLSYLGRFEEAEEAGRNAVEHDPEDFDAYENLAFIWIQRGKQVEARGLLEAGLARFPDSSYLHHYLGWSYLFDPGRNFDQALSHLQRSLQLPDDIVHPYNHVMLAECHFRKGDWTHAQAEIRKALETNSEDGDIQNWIGSLNLQAGKYADSLAAYDRAIELSPLEAFPHSNKGLALFLKGNLDEALQSLRRAQGLLPRTSMAFLSASRVFLAQGNADQALRELFGAIKVDPLSRNLHAMVPHLLDLARPRLRTESLTEAVAVLEGTLEAASGQPPGGACASTSLALVLAARNGAHDRERALEVLLPVLEGVGTGGSLDPTSREALRQVLETLTPDAPGAAPLALLPRLLPYQPLDVALALQPAPQDLEEMLRRPPPAEGEPEARKRFLYLQGSLLARNGRVPEAILELEALEALDRRSPDPVLRLAEVLRRARQPERAESVLSAALADARGRDRRLWDLWLAVGSVDLQRSMSDMLESERGAAGAGDAGGDYRGDVLWLLERLREGESVRIRCGGGEYLDPGGKVWGKDRFFRGGRSSMAWGGEVQKTESDPLYQAERYFPLEDAGEPSAYAIPLPPGNYRVHLHFAEVCMNIPGFRRFDVLIQEKKVLEDFDSLKSGFATAIEEVFDARVDDGLLEIRFIHRPSYDAPKVSAIEVERKEN